MPALWCRDEVWLVGAAFNAIEQVFAGFSALFVQRSLSKAPERIVGVMWQCVEPCR
jgi:hypothetical protein